MQWRIQRRAQEVRASPYFRQTNLSNLVISVYERLWHLITTTWHAPLYPKILDPPLLLISENSQLSFCEISQGHDTTAAAANWAVHLIGSYPEVQARLHEEMDAIFGDSDRPATMADIKEMKYLERVIKETLRLYPSVPIIGRTFEEDCVIGKHKPLCPCFDQTSEDLWKNAINWEISQWLSIFLFIFISILLSCCDITQHFRIFI